MLDSQQFSGEQLQILIVAEGADALSGFVVFSADNHKPLVAPFNGTQRTFRFSGTEVHSALKV
ncbi:hypothetical protein D3C80_2133840 [compost metagenome]